MTDVAKIEHAPNDDILSLSDVLALAGTARSSGKSSATVVSDIQRKAAEEKLAIEARVSVITVKHRWIKGKTFSVNTTIIPFGMDGIAKVKNLGNALPDVESYIRSSHGLAEIVSVEAPQIIMEAVPAAPTTEPVAEPEVMTSVKEELLEAQQEESEPVQQEEPEEVTEPLVEAEEELPSDPLENAESYSLIQENEDVFSSAIEERKPERKPVVVIPKKSNIVQTVAQEEIISEDVEQQAPTKARRGRPKKVREE